MDNFEEVYEKIRECSASIDTALQLAEENARILGVDVYDLRAPDGTYLMNKLIANRIELRNRLREVETLDAWRKAN